MRTILLALNEINFQFVEKYIQQGFLPNFKNLFQQHGYSETTSESEYQLLEPWIQWVTVHTGKTYAEHQVFRLGDMVQRPEIRQIFEVLEERGYRIGAVSPFNTANRLKHPAFFVPDPWTKTRASGTVLLREISQAVAQAVNDNAQARLTSKSLLALLAGLAYYTPLNDYPWYLKQIIGIRKNVATKALILDKLLSDVFIKEWKKAQPDFSLLFLNSGAHLQHHYLFNSRAYEGNLKNPEWYCPANQDPILAIYQLYDDILGRLIQLPDLNLILATGLSQQPHSQLTFYWRLKEHENFLKSIGIENYKAVHPRMSRDFLIEFASSEDAKLAEQILAATNTSDGERLFNIDNRGQSLFVELVYAHDIQEDLAITVNHKIIPNLKRQVAFVALKNGEHNSIGFYLDANHRAEKQIPLTQIYQNILQYLP